MMAKLKRWWIESSASIDAISLRERILLFISVLAGCIVLADLVWLSPTQLTHRSLLLKFEKNSTELQRLRTEAKALVNPVNTDKGVRADLAAAKISLDSVNQTILDILPTPGQATPLAQILVHLLRRHAGLTLLRTSTLAPDAAGTATTPDPGVRSAELPSWLTRQGVELTVSGPYPDLTQYLASLEMVLPHVMWGTMTLKSEKLPPELTLQLFLVEVKP